MFYVHKIYFLFYRRSLHFVSNFSLQHFILYKIATCNWTRISKHFEYLILESTFPKIHIFSMQHQKY